MKTNTQIFWYFVIVKGGRAYHYCQSRDEALAFRVELGEEL